MESFSKILNPNHPEAHTVNTTAKLNWLRASVLGANDGIISIAGLVFGVAGVTQNIGIIAAAGIAGIIAGAISMAAGEYVSVSSSRDTEKALLKKERYELQNFPEAEFAELISLYERKGLSRKTATAVAKELTKRDAFAAHVDIELGIDPDNLTNPWHAAIASSLSFLGGALIPFAVMLIPPAELRIPVTFVAVVFALAATGTLSAIVGGASIPRAASRVVVGGIAAMAITYTIGRLLGVTGI